MKRMLRWMLALWAAGGFLFSAAAYSGEPEGFGDMRWGDSVKKVSERYATQYLEDTVGGGALYAVNFTDFTEQMGISGPLVVTGAFEKDRLVQINVPLALESREAVDQAFAVYVARLESTCGAPTEKQRIPHCGQDEKPVCMYRKWKKDFLSALSMGKPWKSG